MPIWSELSWPHIKECAEQGMVVVLPVGVVEQHGYHLPVDTDAHVVEQVAHAAARREPDLLAAPTVAFGFTPSNKNFPGSISLTAGTWLALVREVARNIARHGFTRLLLLNGHGGQRALSQTAAAALQDEDGIRMVALFWYSLIEADMKRLFPEEGVQGSRVGHAGGVETSLNLYLRPQLARQGELSPNLTAATPPFIHAAGGFVQTPREELSPSGVIGDPRLASAEKGEDLFRLGVDRLCEFTRALRQL